MRPKYNKFFQANLMKEIKNAVMLGTFLCLENPKFGAKCTKNGPSQVAQ